MIFACAVAGCTNNSNSGVILRCFPRTNSPKFKEWIKATRNKSLDKLTPEYIKLSKRVCNIHFTKTYQQKSVFLFHEMPIPTENLPPNDQDFNSSPEEQSIESINIKQKVDDKKDEVVQCLTQFLNFKKNTKIENNVPQQKIYLKCKIQPKKVKLQINRMFVKISEKEWKSNITNKMNSGIVHARTNQTMFLKEVDSQRKSLKEIENRNISSNLELENRRRLNETKIINMQYDFELGQTQVIDINSEKLESDQNDKITKKNIAPVVSTVDQTTLKSQVNNINKIQEPLTNNKVVRILNAHLVDQNGLNKLIKQTRIINRQNHFNLMNMEKPKLKEKTYKQLQSQVYYLKKRVEQYKEQLKEFQQFQKLEGFVQRFFKSQLNNSGQKNGRKTFTFEDMMFAYRIYSRSRICYNFLESNFSLPSTTILDDFHRQIKRRDLLLNAINDLEKNNFVLVNDNAEAGSAALYLLHF